ncbi:MAG: hypothetical protein HYZ15_01355 [Sphingobacteriales bacterium]|nr:hypothetical protein [Sphingobacteriales bacterium]
MKNTLLLFALFLALQTYGQYIGVRARYTETRLVDDAPNPSKRQNRLVLSFFEVDASGVYTPVNLTNYDIWVYKEGLQYGSPMGGVQDSAGNNYPGYSWTAPRAVSYYNSLQPGYVDCDPSLTSHFIVSGHELDCGFVGVSYWDIDYGTGQPLERFTAPNICLPYYFWPDPLAMFPGNVNFNSVGVPTAPYNLYNYSCVDGVQQEVIRGVLPADSTGASPLPVTLAYFEGTALNEREIKLGWSNLTELGVDRYEIQRAMPDSGFKMVALVWPFSNSGGRSDYSVPLNQPVAVANYRIKVIENSGAIAYSPVIQVKLPGSQPIQNDLSLTVYPNPAYSSRIQFSARLPQGRYTACLVNLVGQQVAIRSYQHEGGIMEAFFEAPAGCKGLYYFQLRSAAGRTLCQPVLIKP